MSAFDRMQSGLVESMHGTSGGRSHCSAKMQRRCSAQKQTEIVLRLLRGANLDLLSRELSIPAARLAAWRETCLDAGQEAMQQRGHDARDTELVRLRAQLGEATRENDLLREKLTRLEADRPVGRRRSRL